MSFSEYRYLVLSDLYRVSREVEEVTLIRNILFGDF